MVLVHWDNSVKESHTYRSDGPVPIPLARPEVEPTCFRYMGIDAVSLLHRPSLPRKMSYMIAPTDTEQCPITSLALVYPASSGEECPTCPEGSVTCRCSGARGVPVMLTGGDDGIVKMIDAANGRVIRVIARMGSRVEAIGWHRWCGHLYVVVVDFAMEASLWRLNDDCPLWGIPVLLKSWELPQPMIPDMTNHLSLNERNAEISITSTSRGVELRVLYLTPPERLMATVASYNLDSLCHPVFDFHKANGECNDPLLHWDVAESTLKDSPVPYPSLFGRDGGFAEIAEGLGDEAALLGPLASTPQQLVQLRNSNGDEDISLQVNRGSATAIRGNSSPDFVLSLRALGTLIQSIDDPVSENAMGPSCTMETLIIESNSPLLNSLPIKGSVSLLCRWTPDGIPRGREQPLLIFMCFHTGEVLVDQGDPDSLWLYKANIPEPSTVIGRTGRRVLRLISLVKGYRERVPRPQWMRLPWNCASAYCFQDNWGAVVSEDRILTIYKSCYITGEISHTVVGRTVFDGKYERERRMRQPVDGMQRFFKDPRLYISTPAKSLFVIEVLSPRSKYYTGAIDDSAVSAYCLETGALRGVIGLRPTPPEPSAAKMASRAPLVEPVRDISSIGTPLLEIRSINSDPSMTWEYADTVVDPHMLERVKSEFAKPEPNPVDPSVVLVWSPKGSIRVWDLSRNLCLRSLESSDVRSNLVIEEQRLCSVTITAATWTPDGGSIVLLMNSGVMIHICPREMSRLGGFLPTPKVPAMKLKFPSGKEDVYWDSRGWSGWLNVARESIERTTYAASFDGDVITDWALKLLGADSVPEKEFKADGCSLSVRKLCKYCRVIYAGKSDKSYLKFLRAAVFIADAGKLHTAHTLIRFASWGASKRVMTTAPFEAWLGFKNVEVDFKSCLWCQLAKKFRPLLLLPLLEVISRRETKIKYMSPWTLLAVNQSEILDPGDLRSFRIDGNLPSGVQALLGVGPPTYQGCNVTNPVQLMVGRPSGLLSLIPNRDDFIISQLISREEYGNFYDGFHISLQTEKPFYDVDDGNSLDPNPRFSFPSFCGGRIEQFKLPELVSRIRSPDIGRSLEVFVNKLILSKAERPVIAVNQKPSDLPSAIIRIIDNQAPRLNIQRHGLIARTLRIATVSEESVAESASDDEQSFRLDDDKPEGDAGNTLNHSGRGDSWDGDDVGTETVRRSSRPRRRPARLISSDDVEPSPPPYQYHRNRSVPVGPRRSLRLLSDSSHVSEPEARRSTRLRVARLIPFPDGSQPQTSSTSEQEEAHGTYVMRQRVPGARMWRDDSSSEDVEEEDSNDWDEHRATPPERKRRMLTRYRESTSES